MDDHTYTHLSARTKEVDDSFYIQSFGLVFEEVTADMLLTVSLDGKVMEGSEYQYNKTGYVIHGAIYKARGDINVIFHLHTKHITAVASIRDGLMPISQWALHFYDSVSYHEYGSLALSTSYGDQLAHDLGKNNIMLMRNHGCIICAKTIHEALFYAYHLERACAMQVAVLAMGREVVLPSHETCAKAKVDLLGFEDDLGKRDWLAWKRLLNC